MSRRRRHELAVAGQVRSLAGAAWIQPVVAAGSLLALLLASAARAGEVSATQGPLDLGTRVNGVAGGRCQGGQCEVTGGTAAGANLFHRFNRFDTRGEIRGVSIQNGVHSTVVLGVLDPMGSFLNKGISLSSPAHLFFLSPGGLHLGAGAQFFNTPRLTLSTASSLGLGSGRFDVFRTTAAEAALLTGAPLRGKGGLSSDPAEAQRNGLTSGGDLVVDGGLIQVDAELLLDAQGANLLLQAGSQLAAPGGNVELSGKNVTVAAGALVSTSAQAPAPADPAVVATTSPTPETPVPPAPAAAQIAAAGLDGGGIRISASGDAVVAGQLKALGVAATGSGTAASDTVASGTVASGSSGKGGRIEVTGQRVALTGAALDASGPAGGGTVLLGGDVRGANPAVPNASSTTVDATSTVRADALAKGDGGTVVAYASQRTEVAGLLSVRGGPDGGNGGFVETSGATVALSRGPDLAAPLGKGGTWLMDPFDITIASTAITLKDSLTDSNGRFSFAALTAAGNGIYYGTAKEGGDHRIGAIYSFDSGTGSISLKASFNGDNGSFPFSELRAAGNGLYYGTTLNGGSNDKGVIYAFDSATGSISIKGSFTGANGAYPHAALSEAVNGLYYGTTYKGGSSDKGAIYAFDPTTGSISLKDSFTGANGAHPYAALSETRNGLYYGTTYQGGSNDKGVIYAFNPTTGSISLKDNFTGANGAFPYATLTLSKAGNDLYYGTTINGGANDVGAIYAFDSATSSISLKGSFSGSNGAFPHAALRAAGDGVYYGTTKLGGDNNIGAIYAFDSATSSISLKGSFNDSNGALPFSSLSSAGNGIYYGTTANGGANGKGAIFSFDENTYVSTATIQSALNTGGNVVISTSDPLGPAGTGNITVNSPINKTGGGEAFLTLNAHNNIILNSNISSTSAALNLNLNADIDRNGSGATSLASAASLSLNGGTATANGPISMATNSKIKDAQIVAPAINSDGGILENNLFLNVDSLRLNGGSLQANGTATVKALNLSAGSITGSGDLQITQGFIRTGGSIAGNFSNLAINQASGSLTPGALSAAGPIALFTNNGQLNLNAPISASTVLARGASGITLSGAAVLTASTPSGRAITIDAGSGAFFNNSTSKAAALSKQPGATWAIYADNPTSTPSVNLGGLPYSFKQYNQTFETNQGSNPILGSGNGLFYANSPTISVNLLPVSKVYDGKVEASLSALNYNVNGVFAGDLVDITAVGAYDNKNAGTGKVVSVSGLTITRATESASGVAVYGYNLSSTAASGAIGTITPRPLSGAAIAPGSSIYGSALAPGAVSFGNIVGSDVVGSSASVNTSTLSSSGKPIVGSYSQSASGLTGTDAGNYSFSGFTSGPNYTISKLPLTGAGIASGSSIYGSALAPGAVSFGNIVGADVVGSSASVNASTFSSSGGPIVGSYSQSASGLTGADAGNYSFSGFTSGPNYTISKLPLTGAGIASGSSIYGSALAPGAVSFGNIVGSDVVGSSASVNTSTLSSSGKPIVGSYSQSASALTGADAGNYSFSGFTSGPSYTISKLPLTGAGIASGSSIYGSALAPGAVSFGNIVGSDVVASSASVNTSTLSSSGKPIVGSYSQSASALTGADAGNYSFLGGFTTATPNYTIGKAALIISALTDSRVYDGTTSSSAAPTVTSGELFNGDKLSGLRQVFDSKNVLGTNQSTLKVSAGYTLSDGNNGNNYAVSLATASGTITPLDLPVTGMVALDKVYDATAVAPLQGTRAAVSPLSGEEVTLVGTAVGAFNDKNVGIDKAVTIMGLTIAGKDAGNYNLLQQTGLVATISRKDLPVTGLLALDKIYDATTEAPLGGSAAVNPFSADVVTVSGKAVGTFADKNVAQAKVVSVSGLSLSGKDAGNYNLLPLTNLTAAVTPAPLQISASSDRKIYDGTSNSGLIPTIAVGSLWGDDRLIGLAQMFESKNALGTGQSKLIVSAYTLSDGNNGSNYALSFLSSPGTISRASVTPSFEIKNKPYDGNVAAEIAGNSLQGGLASDDVFIVGASAFFDNASTGNDKLVTITGYTLSGQAANNYQLSPPAATSRASITMQQDNRALMSNEEPIKIEEVNPAVGVQLSKLSSPTISKSDDIDISNVTQLPPVASPQEVTPSDSMQPQAPSSTTAMSATQAGSTQSQPTISATAVSSGSATNQYQESDQRSADDAKTSLGLSNVPTTEAISPARLQLVMQDAASLIRKYSVRMLNP